MFDRKPLVFMKNIEFYHVVQLIGAIFLEDASLKLRYRKTSDAYNISLVNLSIEKYKISILYG